MYKKDQNHQFGFTDFNQPMGLKMNQDNRWIKKAQTIPWNQIEDKYAELFPSETGMPAKPLRTALGSLIIQKKYGYSDRELVEQITENPYYQFFIGLPGYQKEPPFVPSLLVEFRKRLSEEVLEEINEMVIAFNTPKDSDPPDGTPGGSGGKVETDPSVEAVHKEADKTSDTPAGNEETPAQNHGTLILDATCAPQNIAFPQDINLLNEAREKLEGMVDWICQKYPGTVKPRTYRVVARKDYLELAKCKKRKAKQIRKAIRKQLQYIRRDLRYIDSFLSEGKILPEKSLAKLAVIRKVYEQQKYMYENKTHSVPDRIVSISQPYIRPIVRGKAKSPTEFGAKLDLSIDDNGMARIEKQSFDAYNENEDLIGAIERYYKRTGYYPKRVLADKIYRNRRNLTYCKEHGIRLSGPALGRPGKDAEKDRKAIYSDAVDRIAVERGFSLAKRCYGLGLIVTKLDVTTRSSIALSVLAMNIDRITVLSFCDFFKIGLSKCKMGQLLAIWLWFSRITNVNIPGGRPGLWSQEPRLATR